MWHPHPNVDPGIDARGSGPLDEPERVVEQHFVVTDMNAGRRHAGKSTEERRSQWLFRVGASQVGMNELRDLRAREKRIGIRARLIGCVRKSKVGNRRQHGNSDERRVGGDGFAGDARRESQGQITSGGISRKGNPANSAPAKPPITCQHIVRDGREGIRPGASPRVGDELSLQLLLV